MFKDYLDYDALGLAHLVSSKQVSSIDVLKAAIAQANKVDPKLNAIIHRFDKKALNSAASTDKGIFAGVPFLFKDLSFLLKDEPITMGSRSVNIVPEYNSEIVNRMLATGVNPFGKTNTPEFGLIITTEPKAHGACHNPFKQKYSTGGSSGGSAAAVSAGIVPIAGAGDGGGSIRFPAAWCGVFGLKPSRGRTPLGPDYGEAWEGAVSDHVITRSVRDSAAMLDAISGAEVGAPYVIAPPSSSFLQAASQAPRPLKIALHQTPLVADTKLHPEVEKTLLHTAKRLEDMGHIVEPAEPDINIEALWQDFFMVVCAHTAFTIAQLTRHYGKQHVANLEPQTKITAMLGRSLTATDLLRAKQGWHDVQYKTGQLLVDYDMVLCPTVHTPAVKHGVLPPRYLDELVMNRVNSFNLGQFAFKSGLVYKLSHPVLSKIAFTVLGNMTGLPAMSVPVGMSKKGLPIGMQLIGRMNEETTLLSLAGEIERAGWFTSPAFAKS